MTQTYSEQRQAAYFEAARKLYRIAAQVLDDTVLRNDILRNDSYVANISRKTCERARELEDRGHEETIAPARAESANQRAKDEHSAALTRYLERKRALTETREWPRIACAECGHLHFISSSEGYDPCPVEGCDCQGRQWAQELPRSQPHTDSERRGLLAAEAGPVRDEHHPDPT